jgi:hypothetical protein
VTTNTQPAPPATRVLRRIGLWGAPRSGKTTYLAALNVAVTRSERELLIFGTDDEATAFLADSTDMLTRERRFPDATQALRPLSWAMQMPTQREQPRRFGRLSKPVMETVPVQLNLDLLDAPGGSFASVQGQGGDTPDRSALFDEDDEDASVPDDPDAELIEHLASCDGIVFLFDPIREQQKGDAYQYFQGTLLRIAQRRLGQGGPVNARLPQYVAVCITKFDDPTVYRRAKMGGYRSFDENDPSLFPRVHDDSAAAFFAELCRVSDLGDADLVSGAIRQYFMPERVRYFITSAIGFYVAPGSSRFQEQDYQNAVPDSTGEMRIRGAVRPINVVEPLLWLGQRLTDDRR